MTNLLGKGRKLIAELTSPAPEPLGMDGIVPVPKADDLDRERERRVHDINCMQGEGGVLLSVGEVNMHGFELFDDDDPAGSGMPLGADRRTATSGHIPEVAGA